MLYFLPGLAIPTRASHGRGATGDAETSIKATSMKSWRLREEAPATANALDTATLKRIQWLFERVCRHGYGAESSLKAAVQGGATRMSQAGATRAAIRSAIAACVHGEALEEPARTTFMRTESRVVSIRKRMTGWADAAVPGDVAVEAAPTMSEAPPMLS